MSAPAADVIGKHAAGIAIHPRSVTLQEGLEHLPVAEARSPGQRRITAEGCLPTSFRGPPHPSCPALRLSVTGHLRPVHSTVLCCDARHDTEACAVPSWWPWATGIGGIDLILAALRWLVAHLPHRRSPAVTLAGSDRTRALTADLKAVAAASATVLADIPGVRSTSGTAITDRGQPTLSLTATLEPTADLATVTTAADRIGTQLATALPVPHIAAQVHLRVARSARHHPRVS